MTRADIERIAAAVVAEVFPPDHFAGAGDMVRPCLRAALWRDAGVEISDDQAAALRAAGWRAP
jgi:hypothetical protein